MSNTITAYFKGRVGVAESVYQNDYGMVMVFDGIELPAHFDCYFSIQNQEEAVPGVGVDNRVAIPNSVLANPGKVEIHIPLHTGSSDSEVEYVVYFRVIGRARPVDDGTPAQMTAIEQALALLQNPITNIEQIVNEALDFTGDTFAEMQEQLDADQAEFQDDMGDRADAFEAEIRGDIADVESDFDNLNAQFQTAVGALTVDDELLNVRVGDDNVTYATAGEAVRKQFSALKSDLEKTVDEVFSNEEITTTTGEINARMQSDGSQVSSGVYDISSIIAVSDAKYLAVDYNLTPTPGYNTIVIAYLLNDSISQANLLSYEETCKANVFYEIPSTAKYIALTCPTGTHPKVKLFSSIIDEIESNLSDLQSELIDSVDVSTTTHYALTRYIINNGQLEISNSSIYDVLSLIPVGDSTSFSVPYTLTPTAGLGYAPVCFFSSDVETTANLVDYMPNINANTVYSIPEGTRYIGLFVTTGSTPTIKLYKDRLDVIENKVEGLTNELPNGVSVRNDTMTTNDSISATVGNLKKNTVLGFSANITTFGSLQIGQGKTTNAETAYLIIDSTNVKIYSYYGSEVHEEGSYAHGLAIANYIDICIEESNSELGFAKIRITSNGQTYTINSVRWAGCNKTIYADAISGSYTNCLLVYYCADYAKEFWLFGDSYFDHWVPKCLEDGYSKFLCDGFSGRNSSEAFESLERNLLHGKPNTIVWCIGMNNGDSGSVNSSWNTYYTKLKNLCEEKGINLILCTIPNVPSVNNNYKNAIIRASGYRYIDLAKAVGSDISTSWYTGLLSSDQVHPSSLGDEMIARFMESALPEITN